jgi:hypothetical protein
MLIEMFGWFVVVLGKCLVKVANADVLASKGLLLVQEIGALIPGKPFKLYYCSKPPQQGCPLAVK